MLDGDTVQGDCHSSGLGWSSQTTAAGEWLQIDLGDVARLFQIKVIMQANCGIDDDYTLEDGYFSDIEVID